MDGVGLVVWLEEMSAEWTEEESLKILATASGSGGLIFNATASGWRRFGHFVFAFGMKAKFFSVFSRIFMIATGWGTASRHGR